MLVNSMVGVLSQCTRISSQHIVHFIYIIISFFNYATIKLESAWIHSSLLVGKMWRKFSLFTSDCEVINSGCMKALTFQNSFVLGVLDEVSLKHQFSFSNTLNTYISSLFFTEFFSRASFNFYHSQDYCQTSIELLVSVGLFVSAEGIKGQHVVSPVLGQKVLHGMGWDVFIHLLI